MVWNRSEAWFSMRTGTFMVLPPGGGTQNLGVAYELSLSGGSWTETVLQNFCESCAYGYYPQQTMILDANGNLYGNTYQGGTLAKGVAFELSPIGGGQWTETVLYNFCSVGACLDGEYPYGPMLFGANGEFIRRHGRWRTIWRCDSLRVCAASPDSDLEPR